MTVAAPDAPPILEVSRISKRFGGIVAVDDVSFHVRAGIVTGLIGPNGAGKTTVFDMLSGMQRPDAGDIRLNGRSVIGLAPHRISRGGVGRTFQSVRVFGNLPVRENLRIAEANGAMGGQPGAASRIAEALAFVEMDAHADKPAGALSYGQRKLVELAMVLVQAPKLIMLDEPAAGVNPGLIERLAAILRRLTESGVSILLVEHNIRFVTDLCRHVVVLAAARVLTEGAPQAVVRDPAVLEAFLGSDH